MYSPLNSKSSYRLLSEIFHILTCTILLNKIRNMDTRLITRYLQKEPFNYPTFLDRKIFDAPDPNIPELLVLGYTESRNALPLPLHFHDGCFEFVYIESGLMDWEVEGEHFRSHSGDIFFTRPNEVHRGGLDMIQPCCFWWVIIRDPLSIIENKTSPNWLNLNFMEAIHVRDMLMSLPRVRHIGSSPQHPLRRLKDAFTSANVLRSVQAYTSLLDFLLLVIEESKTSGLNQDLRSGLHELTNFLQSNLDQRYSLAELAAKLGVSPPYCSKIFKEYTGLPPASYMEHIRVRQALDRLRTTSVSITDIAHELGFASSQHFSTVFKRHTGRTPSAWRLQGFQ